MPQKQPAATVQSCAPSGRVVAAAAAEAPVPSGTTDIAGERPKERVKKRLTKDVKGMLVRRRSREKYRSLVVGNLQTQAWWGSYSLANGAGNGVMKTGWCICFAGFVRVCRSEDGDDGTMGLGRFNICR